MSRSVSAPRSPADPGREIRHDASGGVGIARRVVAFVAEEEVVAEPADQRVVVTPAEHLVGAGPPVQDVHACVADEDVGECPSDEVLDRAEGVGAVVAGADPARQVRGDRARGVDIARRIDAGAADQGVVAGPAEQRVVCRRRRSGYRN